MPSGLENWPDWTGDIAVEIRDLAGNLIERREFRNLITNAGLNLLRDALGGFVTDAKIKYVAVGTGATAPAVTDTQLASESFRKAVTTYTQSGTGQVQTVLYIAPGEANIAIAEIGWFAGAGASATANSGVMVARVLYSHTHTTSESIDITRTDTI